MAISTGSIVFDGNKCEYEVLELIGRGGFGDVYKCQERQTKKLSAVKTLPTLFADSKTLSAFKNDAQMATKLNHPNVIRYEFFHDGEHYPTLPPYILMEYAKGGTLELLLKIQRSKSEFLANEILVSLFQQLIDGMEAINSLLIHRDVKPANILLGENQWKIADFGLAKLVQEATRTSTFKGFGTMQYLAPEAWKLSEKNTIQMDIYSMGLVFYELATLQYPYHVPSADPNLWMEAHLFQRVASPQAVNSNINLAVSQMILKMVEKRPSDRFPDWQAIRNTLLSGQPASVPEDAALIEKAIKKRLDADAAQQAAELAETKKRSERELFLKTVASQFENEIVMPIKALIDQLNASYSGRKATVSEAGSSHWRIHMPSGNSIELRIAPILSENFEREVYELDDFGHRFQCRRLMLPHLQGRKVIAWGALSSSSGRGYNLILLDRPDDPYGEWRMLINTMGVPSDVRRRPEPFAFALNELEKEIRNVGALHVYNIRASELDMSVLKSFVAEHF